MSEIAIADLEPRWQAQATKLRQAAEQGDATYVIAVAERVLEEFPGCLEVRQLLRAAQRKKARKNTTGFARWLGGMGVQLRTGGLSRKNPRRALREAEEALTRDPENLAAHRLLGQAALAMDLPLTAVFAFHTIRELDPDDHGNLLALGAALIKADRADDAIRLAEEMLSRNEADAAAEGLLKDASVAHSLQQGNWEQPGDYRPKTAEGGGSASLATRPETTSREDLRSRAQRLETEIKTGPTDIRRYRELAEIWHRLGEPVPALDWIEKALQLPHGAHDPGLLRLAGELRSEGLRQRVSAARAEVESRPESAAAREALERIEAEAQAFERSRLANLVRQYPNDAGFRLALAQVLLTQGEAEAAALHFQRALNDPPHRRQALLGLGRAFKLHGRHDLALQQFERALAETSGMGPERKALLYEKADTAQLLERATEARSALEEIYAVDVAYRDVAARLDALDRG
jgi:tetratricopeptide (TPR) repeat protein